MRELARQQGVSLSTVVQAYRTLEDARLLRQATSRVRIATEMLDYIGLLEAGNEELTRFAWKKCSGRAPASRPVPKLYMRRQRSRPKKFRKS